MKNKSKLRGLATALGVAGALSCMAVLSAHATEIGFGNYGGGTVDLNGVGGVTFSAGNNLTVTQPDTDTGSAVGFKGSIQGTFSFAPVANQGILAAALAGSPGQLTISDGVLPIPATLTADITWDTITVVKSAVLGGLSLSTGASLTNIKYNGLDVDLSDLAAAKVATIDLQFTPRLPGGTLVSLYDVSHGIALNSSFSGLITWGVPDGGLTIALFGFALMGIEGLRRKLAK